VINQFFPNETSNAKESDPGEEKKQEFFQEIMLQ